MRLRFCLPSILSALAVLCIAASLEAEVLLPRLFSNDGILQRGIKVPIWGSTNSDEPITVSFAGQEVQAQPKEGKWRVELAPLEASSTGRDLVVKQGDQTVTRKNILVGDVWLCGGQSNMQWEVRQSTGKDEAVAAAANPNLRLFTVKRQGKPQPLDELTSGGWQEAGPKTVGNFSAVGYYFGRALQAAVDVPVGLISSNVGGTTAERWMAIEAINSNAEIKDLNATQGKSDLYNAMIAPLAPYAVKGAIWYQGESNADRPYNYRHVLSAMIKNWRDTMGCGQFPFLIVELAPFTPIVKDPIDQEWAVVRESMQWVAKNVPHTATVSIVDVGDEKDIHPQQKRPVGERLANVARAMVYGEKITPAGPQFDSVKIDGNKAIVHFKNSGGLEAKNGELTGFTIAGEDKKFHHAKAKIEGETVVVTSDAVSAPKSVRYGWANYPVMNLFNKEGFPAHPFRSDDWEVVKQNAR
jgi:sialate O-acetylesterase